MGVGVRMLYDNYNYEVTDIIVRYLLIRYFHEKIVEQLTNNLNIGQNFYNCTASFYIYCKMVKVCTSFFHARHKMFTQLSGINLFNF